MNGLRRFVSLMTMTIVASAAIGQSTVSIIPQPVKLEVQSGEFEVTSDTVIAVEHASESVGRRLAAQLRPATGFALPVRRWVSDQANRIVLKIDPSLEALGQEGYRLDAGVRQVVITAPSPAGLFYGGQTLRQLLPTEIFSPSKVQGAAWTVPCVKIEDYPRFGWRGMMLDTSRHFMPKEFVMKFIDVLALHKMNTFHWHLNEDQGWRIEIKKYPKLTEISSWRKETVLGRNTQDYDGTPHGGFYTQEEIREIVAYAQQQFITIVPEIEMPGHCMAVLAAYPELSCTGGPFEVQTRWGIMRDVYCAGNDKVFEFLKDVLTETMELFPGEYIHIGGDECPKVRWEACPHCQARIEQEGLADEHELQSYFVQRIERFLNAHGRRLIGWDEILEGGLAPNATVMSWRGESGGIQAARAGHDVVMASNTHLYFDYYQADPQTEPLAIGGFIPLERVYSYDPVPSVLTDTQKKHILGVQAQIWTEYISTPEHAAYMAFPRGCALSEIAWTPMERKDYSDFYNRMTRHTQRLSYVKMHYRPLDPPRIEIGRWSSGQTDETYQPMTWDVGGHLQEPGTYTVHFSYTHGAHRLDIREVQLLSGDVLVATDVHEGRTGGSNYRNTYKLVVPQKDFDPQAAYRLRAVVRSDGGSDSNGIISITKDE